MEKATELRPVVVEEVDPLDAYVDDIVDGPDEEPKEEPAAEVDEDKTDEAPEDEETTEEPEDEPEYLEFKYKGQKVKKSLDEVLDLAEKGMGADFKFQEAAEMRKVAEQKEQQLQQMVQFHQQTQNEHVQLAAMDLQLKQYQDVDWNAYVDQDPISAQKDWQKFQMLEKQRDRVAYDLNARFAQMNQQRTAEYQQKVAEGLQTLQNELGKDWNKETQTALMQMGQDVYGFSKEELDSVIDTRMVKVLLDANKWQKLQSSKVQTMKKITDAPKLAKPGTKQGVTENPQRTKLKKMLKSGRKGDRESAAFGLLDEFIS